MSYSKDPESFLEYAAVILGCFEFLDQSQVIEASEEIWSVFIPNRKLVQD